jgi:Methyltransferase domain
MPPKKLRRPGALARLDGWVRNPGRPLRCSLAILAVFGIAASLRGGWLHKETAESALGRGGSGGDRPAGSTPPASLANKESFGFFDDIPNDEWIQRQQRARAHKHQIGPKYKVVDDKTNPQRWLMNNYYPLFTCPNQQRVGTGGDGPKWVCDPLRLRKVTEADARRNGKCLVYSIGCNGDYTFEDAMVDLVGAGTCEVHVFDVAPKYDRPDENAARGIHFHPWGLKSSYRTDVNKGGKWEFLSLQETMTKLGHEGRTIDVFKIDCEECTWQEGRGRAALPPCASALPILARLTFNLVVFLATYRRMDDLQGSLSSLSWRRSLQHPRVVAPLPTLFLALCVSLLTRRHAFFAPAQDWIGIDVDIRQLLVETHGLAEGKGVKTSDFFDDIQKAGFAMFSKEPNIHPQSTPGCAEWSFLRLDKAFFGATP